MGYDRYDRPDRTYGRSRNTTRSSSERRPSRGNDYDRDDRDFFDRAGDEVRSWFGDDRAERRRELDERYGYAGDGYRNQHFDFENNRDSTQGYRRSFDDGDSRYGRDFDMESDDFGRTRSRRMSRDFDRTDRYDYDRGYGQGRFGRPQTQAEFTRDDDYGEWRTRQIDALDRDYDDFRRENQERFDSEFSQWRERRNSMRQQLSDLDDDAQIVGSDGEPIGQVKDVRGDRIICGSDDDNGRRSMFNLRNLDSVENGQVKLNMTSEMARKRMKQGRFDDELVLNRSDETY